MAKLKYVNSNNKFIELGNTAPFLITAIDGLGSPQNEVSTQKSPYQDGVTVTGSSLEPRNIALEGKIIDSNRANRQKYRNTLLSIFNPKLDGKLIIDLGNVQRQVDCIVEQAPYFASNSGQNHQDFLINLLAPNPFWQSIKDTETDLVTWIPNLEFPEGEGWWTEQTPNYWLESRIKQQYLEVYPNGTVYWEPVIKDKAVYSSGISVELPIDELESVTANGVSIPLDTVTVAQDGFSFTSESIVDGDIVEYVYWYPEELTTVPTMQVGPYVIEGGIGSLPSDANGQVSVSVGGLTATNLLGVANIPSTIEGLGGGNRWVIDTTGKLSYSSLSNSKYFSIIAGRKYYIMVKLKDGSVGRMSGLSICDDTPATNNVQILGYTPAIEQKAIWTATFSTDNAKIYVYDQAAGNVEFDHAFVYDLTSMGLDSLSLTEVSKTLHYVSNTKSTVGAGRVQSTDDVGNVISELYYVAKDPATGEIIELKSVPSAKDEVRLSDNKLIKRVSGEVILDGSENWDSYSTIEAGLQRYYLPIPDIQKNSANNVLGGVYSPDFKTITVDQTYTCVTGIATDTRSNILIYHNGESLADFKLWLQTNPATLTYQLAEPEIIPLPQETENPFEDFLSEFGTGTPVEFGYREINQIVEIDNTGDVDCPIKVVFRASGDVVKPYIQNVETRELLRINKTLKMGDVLEITTEFGNKNVYLNGEKAHHYLDFLNSTWLQLSPGINLIKYDAEHGLTNLECSIYYTPQYLGV